MKDEQKLNLLRMAVDNASDYNEAQAYALFIFGFKEYDFYVCLGISDKYHHVIVEYTNYNALSSMVLSNNIAYQQRFFNTNMKNNTACRMCNFRKGVYTIEQFRREIQDQAETAMKTFGNRMSSVYGLISYTPHEITFYFEKVNKQNNDIKR